LRSVTILATSKTPDNVALTGRGIFWLDRNETPVSTSEATNSRLVTGVAGVAALGLDLDFLTWYQTGLGSPGTGSPQVKHSESVLVIIPLQELHRVMPN